MAENVKDVGLPILANVFEPSRPSDNRYEIIRTKINPYPTKPSQSVDQGGTRTRDLRLTKTLPQMGAVAYSESTRVGWMADIFQVVAAAFKSD